MNVPGASKFVVRGLTSRIIESYKDDVTDDTALSTLQYLDTHMKSGLLKGHLIIFANDISNDEDLRQFYSKSFLPEDSQWIKPYLWTIPIKEDPIL